MSNAEATEAPPPFKPGDAIQLSAVEGSKIIGVSVYTGRAEITRLFKFKTQTGQNQVNLNGLPNGLDHDSLRVEGRGAATIHDVTISVVPRAPSPTTSPALEALLQKKDRIVKALERCKKSLGSIELYLNTLNVQHIAMSEMRSVMADYDKAAEELDIRGLELEGQLKDVKKEIETQLDELTKSTFNEKLNRRVAIGIFAASEGEVEIVLTYAVRGATWDAGYDVRVDMQTKEEPVTLIYKAAIKQSTGEDWTDVPLTLETATPTFGVGVPTLNPWNLSIFKPAPELYASAASAAPPRAMARGIRRSVNLALDDTGPGDTDQILLAMDHSKLSVMSKGNVSATFQVPGMISIPSDNNAHNVTIVQLKLNATMSWICVPKHDTKVHLKAKVKNASEYTLLRGTGSIYVDRSFISRSEVPAVSPGESFDCSLGLDPSIRVTYHPQIKKVSKSGFYNKTSNHVYSQQITIFNTKAKSVDDVLIVDHVPVSEDEQIKVKLVSPALTVGPSAGEGTGSSKDKDKDKDKALQKLSVGNGVMAQWDGTDELETDGMEALGKNGKINWKCSIPPQGKVNLILQWEVTTPVTATIMGL